MDAPVFKQLVVICESKADKTPKYLLTGHADS